MTEDEKPRDSIADFDQRANGQLGGPAIEGKVNKLREALAEPVPEGNDAPMDKVKAMLDPQVQQVIGIVLRGLLVSGPGIPPGLLFMSVARVAGGLMSDALQGDIGPVLRLRADMKKAFAEGVDSVKPRPAEKQPPRGPLVMGMPAPPPRRG
jgi:hypothetical protein